MKRDVLAIVAGLVILAGLGGMAAVAISDATATNPTTTTTGGGHTPVTFCHKPGTPAAQELTTDDDGFLQGHLGHGDTLGPCPTETTTTTETEPAPCTPARDQYEGCNPPSPPTCPNNPGGLEPNPPGGQDGKPGNDRCKSDPTTPTPTEPTPTTPAPTTPEPTTPTTPTTPEPTETETIVEPEPEVTETEVTTTVSDNPPSVTAPEPAINEGGELPMTGFSLWWAVALGLALGLAGAYLIRRQRSR